LDVSHIVSLYLWGPCVPAIVEDRIIITQNY